LNRHFERSRSSLQFFASTNALHPEEPPTNSGDITFLVPPALEVL